MTMAQIPQGSTCQNNGQTTSLQTAYTFASVPLENNEIKYIN